MRCMIGRQFANDNNITIITAEQYALNVSLKHRKSVSAIGESSMMEGHILARILYESKISIFMLTSLTY